MLIWEDSDESPQFNVADDLRCANGELPIECDGRVEAMTIICDLVRALALWRGPLRDFRCKSRNAVTQAACSQSDSTPRAVFTNMEQQHMVTAQEVRECGFRVKLLVHARKKEGRLAPETRLDRRWQSQAIAGPSDVSTRQPQLECDCAGRGSLPEGRPGAH